MRKYKTSKRGLTFSITPDEQYYPGSHYVYEVRRNCIIIRPSEEGMTVSRKKCGVKEKALFDIRQKDVRRAVSTSDYLEMEVKEDRIVVRCVREIRNRIIFLEEVMKEFCISKANLSIAAGMEGQITFDEYLASITEDTQLENDLKQVFSVMSLFSGAGMLDWAFYKDPAFEIRFACDYDKCACESYRHNIGDHIFHGDVRTIHGNDDPYNLIIGGPSCKPFSASNRRKMAGDHQDVDLVNEYIRITKENRPEVFVIENVPQFITCEHGRYMDRVMNGLGNTYEITSAIVRDTDPDEDHEIDTPLGKYVISTDNFIVFQGEFNGKPFTNIYSRKYNELRSIELASKVSSAEENVDGFMLIKTADELAVVSDSGNELVLKPSKQLSKALDQLYGYDFLVDYCNKGRYFILTFASSSYEVKTLKGTFTSDIGLVLTVE